MATPHRWLASTRGWTCGRMTDGSERARGQAAEHWGTTRTGWLRLAVHGLALLPLGLLLLDTGLGRLSVNPIQDLALHTGKAALILLMLSLACTPLNILLGWKWALALRKPLGLSSFPYVCVPAPAGLCGGGLRARPGADWSSDQREALRRGGLCELSAAAAALPLAGEGLASASALGRAAAGAAPARRAAPAGALALAGERRPAAGRSQP